ncbi:MAG: D-aminoacyl-tRNA deacylase [Oscillospiraceae bacterium]|nr:D-aminoacyl-tRNA deacylase [Oscillospiraceae bacterium]
MKAVIQRVTHASVTVDNAVTGSIGEGFLVLLGVAQGDTQAEAALLAAKIAKLRVFRDEQGKMNLSLLDTGGAALVISQFTLCADIRKGNRPAFTDAAPPGEADALYRYFCDCLRAEGVRDVQTGVFGAEMRVELLNHGPVTILMDTDTWKKHTK